MTPRPLPQRRGCHCCAHCNPCACVAFCCDSDPDGEGVCKSLPRAVEPALVSITLVHRDDAAALTGTGPS